MYDYGARMYMPDIGRWGVHDPLSELQFKYSPYAYTYNNPILFNDPTGMIGEDPKQTPEFINGGKAKNIEEVVITKVTPKPSKDSSLSWMGINSLSSFHSSQDRWAAMINSSPAALATEQFEKNLANGMGTVFMGGGNILASSGWAAFDAWLEYQDPEDQEAIAAVQYAAILFQLRHGNVKGAQNLIDDAAKKGLTNRQLVQKSATLAERAIGGTGGVAGTAKHQYASKLLNRYQRIYGDRGLLTNHSFNNGVGNRGFLDVLDSKNGIIYDFKFGKAVMSPAQFNKYTRNFGLPIQIIRP